LVQNLLHLLSADVKNRTQTYMTVLLLEDFGMLRHVEWQIFADVSKDLSALIVRIKDTIFVRV
jgi:hypothetical protein